MTTDLEIKSILSPIGVARVSQVRDLWKISVGGYSTAGKNGAETARRLLDIINRTHGRSAEIAHPEPVTVSGEAQRGAAAKVELQTPPPTPEVVEKVIENPETQERLAEALRKLSEAEAALDARKAGADIPPADIADLIRLNESYERTNERLVEGYRDAMQRAELARTRDGTFEGKSTTEWLRKAERYDSAIQWNRGRATEAI